MALRTAGAHSGLVGRQCSRLGVLGVRREDKNKWERRVPLAPKHVKALVGQGLKVVVQPCGRRAFHDSEYFDAGAVVQEDLSECSVITAVKEVPIDLLLPNRTWCFFSHTIKGQPTGMPLLDAVLARKVRLVDYECITQTGVRGGPRLVAFGNYAGLAGAIDFLRGLGERFLAMGYSTPLLHIGSAFMYPSLQEARRAVSIAGEAIISKGLPEVLCPFTVVVTGTGNVSHGALEILQLLPHEMVAPGELAHLDSKGRPRTKILISVVTAQDMVRRQDGGPFSKEDYYLEPNCYESTFHEKILPYSSAIVNGMYWDARFPRLFTSEDLTEQAVSGTDKLLGVCDITCDTDGSVPTRQFTSIEQPFFIYNALTGETTASLDEPGVLFHAVDHLPSELPREASEYFGDCLLPFLPSLARARAPESADEGRDMELPLPIRGAIVAEGGELTRDFKYIHQLRVVSAREAYEEQHPTSQWPSSTQSPPACVTLDFSGHLFDTRLVNQLFDVMEDAKARAQILNIDVGGTVHDESKMTAMVMAHSEDDLKGVIEQVEKIAADAKVLVRDFRSGTPEKKPPARACEPLRARVILVLGSGFVSAPLVEYLLRRPENSLVVASLASWELEDTVKRFGQRVRPEVLDVTSLEEAALRHRDDLVREADIVVSLIPASLHVGVARLCVEHGKPMVTASYVSDDMKALDDEANRQGVLILNEVGLDPGIDHMSAMKMIDDARRIGAGRIIGFSSLCGGLPAPEAAGSNPLGYKFSWNPKGVLLAACNSALFRRDGVLQEVPGADLLAHAEPLVLNKAFALEVLPNRDATIFAELYGLSEVPSFFRGTLRYQGFCDHMLFLARLGLLDSGPHPELRDVKTLRSWLARLLNIESSRLESTLRSKANGSAGLDFLSWLGLLEETSMPDGVQGISPIDVTSLLLQRKEMLFKPGERDMVIMHHEMLIEHGEGHLDKRVATLVQYGEPRGDTAMARTVGLTVAICVQLVLNSPRGHFGAGVQRPLKAEWYEPVLRLLEDEGIFLEERTETTARL